MKLLRGKFPVWATVVIVALAVVSAVIASVMVTKKYPSTVTVVTEYDLELWNEAKTEPVTTLDFGDLSIIGDVCVSDSFWIKNIGNAEIWTAWTSEDLPVNFALKCEYCTSVTWYDCTELQYNAGSATATEPGEFSAYKIRFTLENIGEKTPGIYSFNIVLNGADTNMG